MMNCHEFENSLEAYIEGVLDDEIRSAMDEHRAGCQVCTQLVKAYSCVMISLNTTEPVAAPQGLENRILAAVEQYEGETAAVVRPSRRFGMIAASISAFGALAASVIFIARIFLKDFSGISLGIERNGMLDTVLQVSKSSLVTALYMLQGYLQGKLASIQLPVQVIYLLRLAAEPIQVPYLSFSFPVYFLLLLAIFPFIVRPYFSDSAYSTASARS